ncbi:nitroreductase family protein [Chloroflexota bacterium]
MNVYEAAIKRRSVRQFKDTPVPYDTLEKCVDAARLAPNGKNQQVCEYIIVDDEKLLPEVDATIRMRTGQMKAKAYIIALINSTLEAEISRERRVTIYDVGLAVENILLVALEQGVGSCPLLSFNDEDLRRILNVPDRYDLALVVAMGYPDESPVAETAMDSVDFWTDDQGIRHVPKRKLEDVLHRNRSPK